MGQESSHVSTSDSDLSQLVDIHSNIEFTINKVKYSVPIKNIRADTTLNYFIRNIAKLKGTKSMCLEGGCGVCIVAAKINSQVLSKNLYVLSSESKLYKDSSFIDFLTKSGVSVACYYLQDADNWNIITIEGIGGNLTDYNILQKTLANMNGSQCGCCSPAMIMNMYSLVARRKTSTKEIEVSFGGNICRCTGYRSILDAFQSFSNEVPTELIPKVQDIEDLYKSILACKDICEDFEIVNFDEQKPIYLRLKNANFFKVFSIGQIFQIFNQCPTASYILNGGNTGNGVYRIDRKDMYIDINGVLDLQRIRKTESTLTLGGGVILEIAKDNLYKYSKEPGFEYLEQLADHMNHIGHGSMRNIGTIGGNLMLKHQNRSNTSDLFLILEAAGAEIHILESEGSKISTNFMVFLKLDMTHKVIYSIVLKQLTDGHVYKLYKLHASKTEEFLVDKFLHNNNTLREALTILSSELDPDHVLPNPSPEYRRKLALALLYKSEHRSVRSKNSKWMYYPKTCGISSGKINYDVDKSTWLVNKPVRKIEALYQTSGEAEYVNDIPARDNEVFCVFALAEAPGEIRYIDASEAMCTDGVIAFYTAKNVPGKNVAVDKTAFFNYVDEPLFAENEITYAGQPYGMIVANSQYEATDAVKKVRLIYVDGPRKIPLLTIEDVLVSNEKTTRVTIGLAKPATQSPGKYVKYVIHGTFKSGSQYHYTMEPQCCICVPLEDELEVFVTTQFITFIQRNISSCLGIPESRINIKVRRLGGAYGAKITRTSQIACACAMAAYKLKRPARMNPTIEEMMKSLGKRGDAMYDYEVGVNEAGKIQYLKSDYYLNQGVSNNDTRPALMVFALCSCYDTSTWTLTLNNVNTNLPCNTWCRGPGAAECAAMTENLMEHIAKFLKKDPIQVRLVNLNADDKDTMTAMVNEIVRSSDYKNRSESIDSFNKENRWKKRGIGIDLMNFHLDFNLSFYAMVSIYSRDGTVAICHGGIEMGQGVNTKVAQVAAYTLGIDMDLISIKPTNNLTAPNSRSSGSNATSDCCTSATKTACEELLKRLEPIRQTLNNPTWQELITTAGARNVDLCAIHQYNPKSDVPKAYSIYGVTVAEVEVDVLTGQHILQRVDILEDTGISLNPEIDVGQIQGAFNMGQGLWTSEELIYDPGSGALTNHRTWNYKPPGANDIPVDFRISFLRNAPNPDGILRSKATGEPAICMSYVIPIAIRNALDSSRADAANTDVWYDLNGPVTLEKTMLSGLTEIEHMTL